MLFCPLLNPSLAAMLEVPPVKVTATEAGILHAMKKSAPSKLLIPAPPNQSCACNECPFMKLNTLEKVFLALRDETPEVTIAEHLKSAALAPLQRMMEWSTP